MTSLRAQRRKWNPADRQLCARSTCSSLARRRLLGLLDQRRGGSSTLPSITNPQAAITSTPGVFASSRTLKTQRPTQSRACPSRSSTDMCCPSGWRPSSGARPTSSRPSTETARTRRASPAFPIRDRRCASQTHRLLSKLKRASPETSVNGEKGISSRRKRSDMRSPSKCSAMTRRTWTSPKESRHRGARRRMAHAAEEAATAAIEPRKTVRNEK